MGNARTQGFGKLLDDIKTLEVNTIIKDNMTARKMPDPANAMLDIAQVYGWYLAMRGVSVKRWLDTASPVKEKDPGACIKTMAENDSLKQWLSPPPGMQHGEVSSDLVRIDDYTFSTLRWAASTLDQYGSPRPAERIVLARICRSCDDIKNLLSRLEAEPVYKQYCKDKSRAELNATAGSVYSRRDLIPLTPDDSTLLRKIWDIGVEDVIAQTTIQLDADVVTRISRQYAGPDQAHVLELHRLGIESAVNFWSSLIAAVGSFVTNLAGSLQGKSP